MSRLLAILGSLFLALTAAADAPRAVHDALFASYIPIEEVKDKPELAALFTEVRDQIWTAAGKAPAFQALLAPFTDLRQFGDACGMPEFLATTGVTAFAQLTPAQRAHALYLLHTCPANDPRRMAMNLRNFYLSKHAIISRSVPTARNLPSRMATASTIDRCSFCVAILPL
jgi:hypothetical protein